MIQREVADRLVAAPGSTQYGAFTAFVNYYTDVTVLKEVPSESFVPAPKVMSAVVRLDMLPQPRVSPIDEKMFFRVIKMAFAQRRKTLLNCMGHNFSEFSREESRQLLEKCGIDPGSRGETLSVFDFCTISDHISAKLNQNSVIDNK